MHLRTKKYLSYYGNRNFDYTRFHNLGSRLRRRPIRLRAATSKGCAHVREACNAALSVRRGHETSSNNRACLWARVQATDRGRIWAGVHQVPSPLLGKKRTTNNSIVISTIISQTRPKTAKNAAVSRSALPAAIMTNAASRTPRPAGVSTDKMPTTEAKV